ncbi:SOS response-associated peptidase family protein [Microbacterium sp. 1P10UB]|uniref:SOS response-associated peptidase family protein n=1 Tax=unclassified Microbacterium TaxID=2609290 RepID=UPI0039A007AE
MCGRFALNAKVDTIIREFVADGGDFHEWTPRYSIAPTQVTPIVRERANAETGEFQRIVDAAIWDFHPAFMKDSKRPVDRTTARVR